MTPQEGLFVIIDLITTKVLEFQNFAEPGVDGYDFLEVCCQGFGSIGCTYLNCSEILMLDDDNCGLESGRQVSEKCFERRQAPTDAPIPIIGIKGAALVSFPVFSERFGSLRIDLSFAAIAVK